MQSFDFTQVASSHKNDFYDYLQARERQTRQKVHSRRPQSNRHVWFIVFALCVCLVGLSAYTLYQEQLFDAVSLNSNSQVAGAKEESSSLDAIVSGAEFSMVLPDKLPENFDINITEADFPYVGFKGQSQKTAILTEGSISSGIVVYVREYDKKLDLNSYNDAILQDLGPAYSVGKISKLPNNYTLTSYTNGRSTQPKIYSSITANNYYLIEVFSDPGTDEQTIDANKTTATFLDHLYLN